MDTHFAPAERQDGDALRKEIETVSHHPVIDELLHSVSGLLAVLNDHRQILAVNDGLAEMLGIDDPGIILGLRPGEAIGCRHAEAMPGGCGTSEFCRTCGAAISIVSALATDQPAERTCALTSRKNGRSSDLYFRVRCAPLTIPPNRFLMLFLQDISSQQRLASLEKVFFHDIGNIVMGIMSGSQSLIEESDGSSETISDLARFTHQLSARLASEIAMQRIVCQAGTHAYRPDRRTISIALLFQQLKDSFSSSPLCANRTLTFKGDHTGLTLKTDVTIWLKVLNNMITNALEATPEGGEARVSATPEGEKIVFTVWNQGAIPHDIAKRIFQRNFSTKAEMGRGLGTYSMKLFGEEILGGRLDFTTSEQEGTLFRFSL